MVSGGGGGKDGVAGKKRKAAGGGRGGDRPAMREPRRGLGVAELERIRARLETAEGFYLVPSLPTAPLPPPPPSHVPGVRHDQYVVGNGAMKRDYYAPSYYGSSQHYANHHVLTRFLASNGGVHAFPRQNQVDNNGVVVNAILPPQLEHGASEAGLYMLQLQDLQYRQAQMQKQHGHKKRHEIAFVNLVDSDDDGDAAVGEEELDLELKL